MSHITADSQTWWKRAAYALLTGMITVVLAVLIAIVFQTWFNDPPVTVTSLDGKHLAAPVCPGDEVLIHSKIQVDGPTQLFTYFSVMDKDQNYNINGTQVANGAIPHPHASTYIQALPWHVPELPPGEYTLMLTFRSTDGREKSLFIPTGITIGDDCK